MAQEEWIRESESKIRKLASRYAVQGHYLLNYEDLIGEGLLLLASLHHKGADIEKTFWTSLRNRYIDLLKKSFCEKRNKYTIDLTEVYNLVGRDGLDQLIIKEKIRYLHQVLSPTAKHVLKELIDPSAETMHRAIQEFVRGQHLHKTGQISKSRTLRVTSRNIAQTLGITKVKMLAAFYEISRTICGCDSISCRYCFPKCH
jgi:hypothetical protein